MPYEARFHGNGRDPDTIQRDLEQTRRELDRTLEAIQHDLSPTELAKQLLGRIRGGEGTSSASDLASRVLDKIRDNPIPAALIAIGVLALAKDTGPSTDDMRQAAGRGKERLRSAAERARGAVGHGEEGEGKARELAGSAKETASHMKESVESGYQRVRERIEDNPIVLGAIGIALGAALGAGLPRSRFEDETFGDVRDELVSRARGSSEEQPGHPVHAYDPSAGESARSVGEPSDLGVQVELEPEPRS